MSITKIDHRYKALANDAWFLYTFFAPVSDTETLIKVGISVKPFERVVTLSHNCPFTFKYAGFTPMGRKRLALRAESRILECFAEYSTRGEWLKVPMTAGMKAEFASKCERIVTLLTGKPVQWQRITPEQVAESIKAEFALMKAAY